MYIFDGILFKMTLSVCVRVIGEDLSGSAVVIGSSQRKNRV